MTAHSEGVVFMSLDFKRSLGLLWVGLACACSSAGEDAAAKVHEAAPNAPTVPGGGAGPLASGTPEGEPLRL
ncbi:MAG: hypothetical protein RJA70_3900 [Pseudomonadota bacterium]|jgi:hypothetical protein